MPRWIILEDEPDLYDFLLQFTEMCSIDGVPFDNGDRALAWIEQVDGGHYDGELPVLALLDYRIGNGQASGGDVARRLRNSPVLGNIAIVLMSAFAGTDTEMNQIARSGLVDLTLNKPLPHVRDLRTVLMNAARRRGLPG